MKIGYISKIFWKSKETFPCIFSIKSAKKLIFYSCPLAHALKFSSKSYLLHIFSSQHSQGRDTSKKSIIKSRNGEKNCQKENEKQKK